MGGIFSSGPESATNVNSPTVSRTDSPNMKRARSDKRVGSPKKRTKSEDVQKENSQEIQFDEPTRSIAKKSNPETPPEVTEAVIEAVVVKEDEEFEQAPSAFIPTQGTPEATAFLFKQFQELLKSKPEKEGFRVELADDNMYQWRIFLFDFPSESQIHNDLKMYVESRPDRPEAVCVEAVFPVNYPAKPPYMRILYPRFHQYTGHITIGGSICVKELTLSGWSSEFKLTQFVIMIRNLLMEGGALVDMSNPEMDYSVKEAQEAFFRVASQHGWKV